MVIKMELIRYFDFFPWLYLTSPNSFSCQLDRAQNYLEDCLIQKGPWSRQWDILSIIG